MRTDSNVTNTHDAFGMVSDDSPRRINDESPFDELVMAVALETAEKKNDYSCMRTEEAIAEWLTMVQQAYSGSYADLLVTEAAMHMGILDATRHSLDGFVEMNYLKRGTFTDRFELTRKGERVVTALMHPYKLDEFVTPVDVKIAPVFLAQYRQSVPRMMLPARSLVQG
jgi:hypothetical protein